MQANKLKFRWVNDTWEPYTKRQASKLRRARGNRWCPHDKKIIREKDYEPLVSEDSGSVGVEKRSEQTVQTRHGKASQSRWF